MNELLLKFHIKNRRLNIVLFDCYRSGRRHRVITPDRRSGRCSGDSGSHHPDCGGQSTSGTRGEAAARETGGTQRVTAPTISHAEFPADRGD